jgi:sulfide:quinone oxidoreductase
MQRAEEGSTMSRKRVLVLGGNFGGLVAALAVKDGLDGDVDVTVVSSRDRFLFNPSLIWLPFGKRTPEQISFPLAPTFEANDVEFVHAEATFIDPTAKRVATTAGAYAYDYLVIATGYQSKGDVVDGLTVDNGIHSITTLEDAVMAGEGWRRFLDEPGDIVIGATQGAGCFGAAYEFLFNTAYQLKKAGLRDEVRLTYFTSEPFLGHFGIGGLPHGESLLGMFLGKEHIGSRTNVAVAGADKGVLQLSDGEELAFRYAMVIPPFWGQDFLRKTEGLVDDKGYVLVRDSYQSEKWDDVYAVGIAAQVPLPWTTPTPTGVPKTGFPTERMAHIAAANIVHQIKGEPPTEAKAFGDIPAVCVMDAGNNGVLILGDKMLPPRKRAILIPGPQNHAAKLAFEKYFIWKMKHGHVNLP